MELFTARIIMEGETVLTAVSNEKSKAIDLVQLKGQDLNDIFDTGKAELKVEKVELFKTQIFMVTNKDSILYGAFHCSDIAEEVARVIGGKVERTWVA